MATDRVHLAYMEGKINEKKDYQIVQSTTTDLLKIIVGISVKPGILL